MDIYATLALNIMCQDKGCICDALHPRAHLMTVQYIIIFFSLANTGGQKCMEREGHGWYWLHEIALFLNTTILQILPGQQLKIPSCADFNHFCIVFKVVSI